MIRTIQDEADAAAYVAGTALPLPDPSAPAARLTALAAAPTGHVTAVPAPGAPALAPSGEVVPGSVWPLLGVDSFDELFNDVGTVARAADFNALVAALLAVETWALRVARGAAGDLASRLGAGGRTL